MYYGQIQQDKFQNENKYKSKFITIKYFQESLLHKSINWQDIEY